MCILVGISLCFPIWQEVKCYGYPWFVRLIALYAVQDAGWKHQQFAGFRFVDNIGREQRTIREDRIVVHHVVAVEDDVAAAFRSL